MKDDPPPKATDQLDESTAPTENEFKAFAKRLLSVPKAEVDRRHAELAKKKKRGPR